LLKTKKQKAVRRKLVAAQQYAKDQLSALGEIHPDWVPFIDKHLRSAALRAQLPELLSVIAGNQHRAIRPPAAWQPKRKMKRGKQVQDFVRHTFVRYEMPDFLLRDILQVEIKTAVEKVFFHLSQGQNLRHFNDFWQGITKMEAHWYLRAPVVLNWQAALAWAQARARAYNSEEAMALAGIYTDFFTEHYTLWKDFLVFAGNNRSLRLKALREIADFVYHQRISPYKLEFFDNQIAVKSLFPTFDIRNAQLSGLYRRMAEQQQELEYWKKNYRKITFPQGPIPDFEIAWGAETYHIRQLQDTSALMAESAAMKHCVRTYHRYCHHGNCFIYSMTKTKDGLTAHVGTIEIFKYSGEDIWYLEQFKAKYNARPDEEAFFIAKLWLGNAEKEVKWDGKEY
jgi:hypothetical protein